MIKVEHDPVNAGGEQKEKAAQSGETKAVGGEPLSESKRLADEAERLCLDMERCFRRGFGEVPKASDLGELRAQQSTVRSLIHRAMASGGGAVPSETSPQFSELTAERDKLKDIAARARADFLNYQSRTAKELERAEEMALRKYMSDLLPILDSFELAMQDARGPQPDLNRVKEAMDMLHQSLAQTLSVRGLERIQAKGKAFDPNIHEAVVKRPADKAAGEQPNMVVEELRPGYLWKGLILRPAQVMVSEPEKK